MIANGTGAVDGRVQGFCTADGCKAEVMVGPDLACPRCGRPVDPLSLPRVPKPEAARPVALPVRSDRGPAGVAEQPAEQPQQKNKAIVLPPLAEALEWAGSTEALLAALDAQVDEAAVLVEQAQAELLAAEALHKRAVQSAHYIRQLQRIILVEQPQQQDTPTGAPGSAGPVRPRPPVEAPPPAPPAAPRARIREIDRGDAEAKVAPPSRFSLGPEFPRRNERPSRPPKEKDSTRRWSREHERCVNPACGTTTTPHASGGRCRACSSYWERIGAERPAELCEKPPRRRRSYPPVIAARG